jgi:diacylglycerol kinase (ATP)
MFTGRSVLVVLNPSSGRTQADELAATLEDELAEAGAAGVEVRRTVEIDDATRWAEAAGAEGFEIVLAVGGDGTVTAVAAGVLRSGHDVTVGIVATGTGNGMARVLHLPTSAEEAVAALRAGHPVRLDAVEVTSHDRWALMFLGVGLDAEINRDADAGHKRRFGYLAYIGATLRNVLGRRNQRLTLTLDDRRERTLAHTISIFNAGHFDVAGLEVGPPADPHDGRLDVAVFRSPSPIAIATQLLRLLTGRPVGRDLVRAEHVRIDARSPLLVHIDGDVIGTTPLEARVRPGAITFLADADYPPSAA